MLNTVSMCVFSVNYSDTEKHDINNKMKGDDDEYAKYY